MISGGGEVRLTIAERNSLENRINRHQCRIDALRLTNTILQMLVVIFYMLLVTGLFALNSGIINEIMHELEHHTRQRGKQRLDAVREPVYYYYVALSFMHISWMMVMEVFVLFTTSLSLFCSGCRFPQIAGLLTLVFYHIIICGITVAAWINGPYLFTIVPPFFFVLLAHSIQLALTALMTSSMCLERRNTNKWIEQKVQLVETQRAQTLAQYQLVQQYVQNEPKAPEAPKEIQNNNELDQNPLKNDEIGQNLKKIGSAEKKNDANGTGTAASAETKDKQKMSAPTSPKNSAEMAEIKKKNKETSNKSKKNDANGTRTKAPTQELSVGDVKKRNTGKMAEKHANGTGIEACSETPNKELGVGDVKKNSVGVAAKPI